MRVTALRSKHHPCLPATRAPLPQRTLSHGQPSSPAILLSMQAQLSCTAGAELAVPLHARYPHPQQGQQPQQAGSWWQAALAVPVVTDLSPPLVLVQCPGGSASDAKAGGQWQLAQLAAEALPQPVRWDRPAGNLRHGPLVASGTAAALLLGVVAVLWALCGPSEQPGRQRPQQKRE